MTGIYVFVDKDSDFVTSFNQYYADPLLLFFIIGACILKIRQASELLDPIYWRLLLAAFSFWFLIAVLKSGLWNSLALSTKQDLSAIGYFLFFTLIIAAIEVKSYADAKHLLLASNIVAWSASFTFVLGAFIYLILTVTPSNSSTHSTVIYHFLFYITMDLYIAFRWFFLAFKTKKYSGNQYVLFGMAFLGWLVADICELANILESSQSNGTILIDWIWYFPFILFFAGLQSAKADRQPIKIESHTAASHWLNSPVFFILYSYILYRIIESSLFKLAHNATQIEFFNFWFSVFFGLAFIQLYIIKKSNKQLAATLAEEKLVYQALLQRTEQQAESLKHQSATNQIILETTHNAIFMVDLQAKILSCNPAAEKMFEIPMADLINQNFIEETKASGELKKYFSYHSYQQKLLASKLGLELESTITTQTNRTIPVHATLSHDPNAKQGLIIVSLSNISEQKKAEKQAHELKDQFTQNISHEFRTPLTIINGVLDNLVTHQPSQQEFTQIQTAKRNVLRMTRMVEQLLDLSRIANDTIPLSPIDINQILTFVCHSFEEVATSQQIQLVYQPYKPIYVNGNQIAAEKVFFNLLSNAFKYTQTGEVSVNVEKRNDQILVSITDTGIGIEQSQIEAIFDRFRRIQTEQTSRIQGAGIGLSLVKNLCHAMKWDISVESIVNSGSTFTLCLPIENVKENEKEKSELISNFSSQSVQQSISAELFEAKTKVHKKPLQKSENSVLIVEDNADMLTHISQILSPHHHCLLADNGEEGVRLAIDYLPDIIISDVMMPGIDGIELLKILKKTDMTSHIPIILLTARTDSSSKLKGLEAEADDYLGKPFDANELKLRVNNQLKSRQKLQQKLSALWQTPAQPAVFDVEDKFMKKLDEIFEKSFSDTNFSMLELASNLAMSDRQMQRKVKSVLGINPLEALKQFRLRKARRLLETGEQIGIIAQLCGFTSQSYFGKCFKESFGKTPKQYQQQIKN